MITTRLLPNVSRLTARLLPLAVLIVGCSAKKSPASIGTVDSTMTERTTTAAGPITVGPNVWLSRDRPAGEHTEYMGDAHPTDPNKLVLCTMIYSPERAQLTSGLYVSGDGGQQWRLAVEDSSSRFQGVADPACAFGLNDDAYFLALSNDESVPRERNTGDYTTWRTQRSAYMPLYRSADGGQTWSAPDTLGFIDNEDVIVDRTTSPYRGRVYVYGNTFPWTSAWLIYSTDGGRTFRQSAETKLEMLGVHAGPGTILPDGTLLLSYHLEKDDQPQVREQDRLGVAASRDGGAHIGQPVEVATSRKCYFWKTPFDLDRFAGATPPVMASDHSAGPFRGRAYIAWGAFERGQCALMLAHSKDAGRTWSKPVRVSDALPRAAGGPDMFLPQIAVNKDGVVGATWYDRREDSRNQNHRLRFSASLDGGETWLPSVPVSTHEFVFREEPELLGWPMVDGGGRRSSDQRSDEFATSVVQAPRLYYKWSTGMGDYAAIAAGADGRFHTFWIDNRTGTAQLYTAAVTVAGRAEGDGDTAVAGLVNVTPLLELQYTSSVYDPKMRTLTLAYQFLNTSRDTVTGPFKMRLLAVESDVGPATVELTNGRAVGAGAVLDIGELLPAGRLVPGQTTETGRLRLRFAPGDLVGIPYTALARINARVFGHRAGGDEQRSRASRTQPGGAVTGGTVSNALERN